MISKKVPLLDRVCFTALDASVSLRPREPSLNAADRYRSGYAVSSLPSAFRGTLLNVFVIL